MDRALRLLVVLSVVMGLVASLGPGVAVAQPQAGGGEMQRLLAQHGADGAWQETPSSLMPPEPITTHSETMEIPEQFQPVDVAVLPRGSGPGEIGILEGPHGEPPIGPSSINVADDGNIFVLDSVNHRVITLSEDGTIQRETGFDRHAWGADLAVDARGNLYILDTRSNRLLVHRSDGQALETALPFGGKFQPNRVAIGTEGQLEIKGWQMSNITGDASEEKPPDQVVMTWPLSSSGAPQRNALATLHPNTQSTRQGLHSVRLIQTSERSGRIVINDETGSTLLDVSVETQSPLAWITLIGYDDAGNVYVVLSVFVPNDANVLLFGARLDKFSPTGELLASAPLPMDMYTFPERSLAVAGNGTVYQLLPEREQVRIVQWQVVPASAAIAQPPATWMPRFDISASFPPNQAVEATRTCNTMLTPGPITRDQIIATAQDYANHTWTVGSSNYNARTCPNGCPVGPAAWPIGTQVTSVAYQWGGWDTVSGFDWKLSQGYLAGDVSGKACVGNCATGVDCSGFVQQTWQIVDQKHNTNQLMSSTYSEHIEWGQLQKGDALGIAGSHITLFSNRDAQGHIAIYESVWGTTYKVRYYIDTWGYLNGYEARRRLNVDDGSPPPPCPQSGGVILYKHAGYDCGGEGEESGYVIRSGTGWENVPGSFNDEASSVKVPSGWSVKLYEHNDRGGGGACRTGDDDTFWGDHFNNGVDLNDKVSSFEVFDSPDCGENHPPNAPDLLDPHDGHVSDDGRAPTLCWRNNGDPDGDSVEFHVEVRGAVDVDSPWTTATCWRPGDLDGHYDEYRWKVEAKDSHGETRWSNQTWYFTIEEPNEPPSISFDTANGAPACGRIESRDRNWTFRGTASDPEGQLDRIDFRCDDCDDSGNGPSSTTGNNWALTRNDMSGKNVVYFVAYDDEDQWTKSCELDLRIDLVPPSTGHNLAGTMGKNGWYVTPVEVHLHANDGCTHRACVGVDEIHYRRRLDGGEWGAWQTPSGDDVRFTVSNDGNHTVEYYAVDKVGNQESQHQVTFKIDKTQPSAPGAITETHGAISGQWQKDWNAPAFIWEPASDATSGVLYYRVEWDDQASTWVTLPAYDPSAVPTGEYELRVWAEDEAGNVSQGSTSFIFRYDGTPPHVPDIHNEDGVASGVWQPITRTANFSWTTPHDDGSGIAGYNVYWGPIITGTSDVLTTTNTFVDGTPICAEDEAAIYYLRARSQDNVGWQSEWVGYALAYDGAPPTATLVANYGLTTTHQTNVHLDIVAGDEGSGVTQMRLSNDARSWSGWTDVVEETYWEIPAIGRRFHPIYLQVIDGAGNVSEVVSDTVYLEVNVQRPQSENFWLWDDDRMAAGGGVVTSTNYNLRTSVGQSYDTPESTSANYVLRSGFQAGALAAPTQTVTYPTYSQLGYVIAGGGACTPTLQSGNYRMYGTLGQPAHVRTITSANYIILSGFWGGAGYDLGATEPILDIWPETCEATLYQGQSTVETLEISNAGRELLEYSISEAPVVTWLWEDPASGAVPADDTDYVDIGFDATGLAPGSYTANLVIDHNDGLPNPYILPCTLNVPECEFYSITINDGALFTNDPDVTLGLCGPDAVEVMLSNDGGFGGATWQPYTRTVEWMLEVYGDYVLPRFVYARYRDSGETIHGTFFDDIIYDPNAPEGDVAFNLADLLPASRLKSGPQPLRVVGQEGAELFISAADDSSGLAEMQVSQSPDFEGATWESYSAIVPITFTEDGVQTVYVRFRDNAGNESGASSDSLIVDTTPPIGMAGVLEGVVGSDAISVTVGLYAVDYTSGVDEVRISALESLTDTLWQPYASQVAVPVSFTGEEQPVLYVQFRDEAGNASEVYSTTYLVDTAPPVLYVGVVPGDTLTRTVTILAYDELTGLDQMWLSNDPLMWDSVVNMPYTSTVTWTFDERRVIWVQIGDSVGNISEPYPAYCALVEADFTAAPTSGVAPLTVVFTNTSSDYTASLWDLGDGVTGTLESPTHTYTVAGVYTVTLTVSGPGGMDTLTRTNFITVYEPVQANFTASPTSGAAPLVVAFTNTSTGDYTASLWAFGDGVTGTLENPTHTYTVTGVYTVSLTVSGPGGTDSITRTNYITVTEPPPIADFTASPLAGQPPLTVTFTDISTGGPITTWLWEFGDGEISTTQHPTHTYTFTGTFTVSLTVTGPGGSDTEVKASYVQVSEEPVIANFTAQPTSGPAPLNVQFTDESAGNITAWLWSFGDSVTSTLQSPTHIYTTKGVYTVTLTVTGPGGSDDEMKTGYITAYEPVSADFAASPMSGVRPLVVTFTNQSTGDYTVSLWDLGDGATDTQISPTHIYTAAGAYTVTLTVSGPGGTDALTRTNYITVYEPVRANFAASPTSGVASLTVAFTNTSSGDYTASLWDFGDSVTGTLESPTHTYTTEGAYTVTLTVTGPGGSDDEVKVGYITVYEPVSAGFTANPMQGIVPLEVTFTNQSTGDYTASLWDFGDEVTSTLESPTHTYTVAGVYTMSLTVSGPGGTDNLSRTNYITVTEPPPIADFTASPLAGQPPLTVTFTDISTSSITSWLWEFGDGETSATQHPTHTYTLTGTFTVSLTVTGPGGSDTEVKSRYIRVSEKPVIANFTAHPTSGPAPLTVQFTDESAGNITSWLWDFGDGVTSTLQSPMHTYALTGTFTVSLTVGGPEGNDMEVKADYITVSSEWQVYLPLVLREQ